MLLQERRRGMSCGFILSKEIQGYKERDGQFPRETRYCLVCESRERALQDVEQGLSQSLRVNKNLSYLWCSEL